MGPRGGDEINLLMGGENYGWPFYTSGVNNDGSIYLLVEHAQDSLFKRFLYSIHNTDTSGACKLTVRLLFSLMRQAG